MKITLRALSGRYLPLLLLLVLAFTAHAFNMFHFPYYENDEGAYMSQAWSLLRMGTLAPYTYWYDHAPAGWLFIALWILISGGFHSFGLAVNSGRVFMLVLHLCTTALLFLCAKKITGKTGPGLITGLFFALSPLAIYFQRRVLLDNIMIFWVFLAITALYFKLEKLWVVILSAVCFGIAVLTKENAILFLPAMLFLLWQQSAGAYRRFAIGLWLCISISVISVYFLYALLNSELLPVGLFGNTAHVSLLATLAEQAKRGTNLPFWDSRSDFYASFLAWLNKDPYLVPLGFTATVLNSVLSLKYKPLRFPALLSWCFAFFLLRGKLVIDFYIVPYLPILALNIGLSCHWLVQRISFGKTKLYAATLAATAFASAFVLLSYPQGSYSGNETGAQIGALNYFYHNVPKNAYIAIDNFAYVDIKEHGYQNAEWFWKIWADPAIEQKFNNDWRNVQYVFLTHEMLRQIGLRIGQPDIIRQSLENATKLAQFGPSSQTYLNLTSYRTTNGDWAAVYQRQPLNQIVLAKSWQTYKTSFIHSYGRIVDPVTGLTTSEGQSYALLRAVWQNDQPAFDGVWSWTKDHLQYRGKDQLFSWQWQPNLNGGSVSDYNSATDADEDIALALLFAYRQFNDVNYLKAAKPIIADIAKNEVVFTKGHYYVAASTVSATDQTIPINPSYCSPATYTLFGQVDQTLPWNTVAQDCYSMLKRVQNQFAPTTGLVPNWLLLDRNTAILRSASKTYGNAADYYGFDAFRSYWRIALDAQWFNNPNARTYLAKAAQFFKTLVTKQSAILTTQGFPVVNYPSLSTTTGQLAVLSVISPKDADLLYAQVYDTGYQNEGNYWGDKNNYYDQNWAWFGTALYHKKLPNLYFKSNERTRDYCKAKECTHDYCKAKECTHDYTATYKDVAAKP